MNLLVSVRNATEALAALAGGADLIDVKEPAHGALGRADEGTIREIAAAIGDRAPLSVAMGELEGQPPLSPGMHVKFVKFGLSSVPKDWRSQLLRLASETPSGVVPAAYAEEAEVGAPRIEAVAAWAIESGRPAMLIDTFRKEGRSLFDLVDVNRLRDLRERLAERGVELALAGSLRAEHVPQLIDIAPAWVGARGVFCDGESRSANLDARRVAAFRKLLK